MSPLKVADSSWTLTLRVRTAEMRTLSQIKPSLVSQICPILAITPLGYDSDSGKTTGNLDEHLERKIALIQCNMVNCEVPKKSVCGNFDESV